MSLDFYLGIHNAGFIGRTNVPTFISMNQLWKRKKAFNTPEQPQLGRVAIDSGGFTELRRNGEWTRTPEEYVEKLVDLTTERRLVVDWVAPQDWMVEPFMLEKTGLTLEDHIERTVDNFLRLRELTEPIASLHVIPVLQGWTLDSYFDCFERYEAAGIDLRAEPRVGVGSVCRRQSTNEIERIMRCLHAKDLSLHGFGVKTQGLEKYAECLASVDSLAWSLAARYSDKICASCLTRPKAKRPKNCANCLSWGLDWRATILSRLGVA